MKRTLSYTITNKNKADTIGAFLQQGGTAFGLAVDPMIVDDRTLRHAIVSNVPVLVVT